MKIIYKKLSVLLLIGAFALLTGSAFAQNITIATGAIVTIDPGATVTGGVLNNSGTLNINSDATGTGSLKVTSVTAGDGAVNVERWLPSTNWHIVSSPVVGQDWKAFAVLPENSIATSGSKYGLAPYDEVSDNWDYFLTTGTGSPFELAKGYVAKRATAAGKVTFTGTAIYAGDKSGISIESTNYGWNAIGNPYTSAIWAKTGGTENFLAKNTDAIHDTYEGLYLWDGANSDYKVIAVGTPTFPDGSGGNLDLLTQDRIAVGQGFIIKAALTTTVSFTTLMQVHASDASGGDAEFKSAEIAAPAVRLSVTSGDLVNRTVVSFDRESTRGLDPGYDVGKLKGNSNIALFTQLVDGSSDVDFMYQSVPDVDYELLTIPVGLDLKNGGDINFTLETSEGFPSDLKVYLEDKALNVTTQLDRKDTQYSASVPSLKGYGRFNLHFTNSTTGIDTDKLNNTNFNVFTRDRLIFVNGPADKDTRFSVYGIDGKMWYQNRAEATNQNTIDAAGFAAGVYLIKIDKQSGSQTVKVVLTN